MKTLIKNGRVVTAVDDYKGDILIEDERISVIGASLQMEVDQTIDAAGRLVIPGGIDPHTHMELPFGGTQSSDDFRTGTIAAAHGGTTSIIDFAVQYKGQSLIEGIDNWHKKAEGKTAIDYGFHLITTELEDKQIEELYTAMDAFCLGYGRPGQRMILRCSAAVFECSFDDLVDDDAVLGVHADQSAARARRRHCPKDRRVIRQKHAGICHKKFE